MLTIFISNYQSFIPLRAQEEAKKQAEKEKLLDKMALDVAKMRVSQNLLRKIIQYPC